MPRLRLVLGVALLAACGGRGLNNPVELTLTNRTGRFATGVLVRFDRPIERIDRLGRSRFRSARLRTAAPDTLLLEEGVLAPGQSARIRLLGRGGPPRFVEGRWLRESGRGPAVKHDEVDER